MLNRHSDVLKNRNQAATHAAVYLIAVIIDVRARASCESVCLTLSFGVQVQVDHDSINSLTGSRHVQSSGTTFEIRNLMSFK